MGHVVSTKGIPSIDQQRLVRGNSDEDNSGTVEGTTGEECPICTELVEIKHLARLNPCNHEFHQDCINQWLDDHSTCPNCRQEVCQVLFNFKGNYKDAQPVLDDPDLEGFEMDDEEEEESLVDLERMSPDHQYLGEEVSFSEWDFDPENDFLSSQVKIKISGDDWMFISFCSSYPRVFLQCTDTFLHWQVLHDDQIVAFVPSNTQLTIRGYYYLHLEDLVIQVNGNKYPLRDDPDFEDFMHPCPETLAFFNLPEAEISRADRIHFFMETLRAHFNEE